MDARTRWETEALRTGASSRQGPPKPAKKRRTEERNWVTLREAEEATGIPTNTLRKWVRKTDLPSYLESDGDLVLRMIDLDAVTKRAKELGRRDEPRERAPEDGQRPPVDGHQAAAADPSSVVGGPSYVSDPSSVVRPPSSAPAPSSVDRRPSTEPPEGRLPDPAWPDPDEQPPTPEGTMLVPIDAWNKMLEQLGNLHEAGQQLADARERAAKAETEATFLRERLAEIRTETEESFEDPPSVADQSQTPDRTSVVGHPSSGEDPSPARPDTTSYWRYLTTGWRQRKRGQRSKD